MDTPKKMDTTKKPSDTNAVLDAISDLEKKHGSMGVCFTKANDFPPQSGSAPIKTEDAVEIVHKSMLRSITAINADAPVLEPTPDN